MARFWIGAGSLCDAGDMTDPEVLADLDRALAAAEAVVAGVHDGLWAAPTPCTELDVRDVVGHLVSGNLLFAAVVRGEPLPEGSADHLGGDPLAAFQRAAGQLRTAFATHGALESVYTAPFGSGSGATLAHVRIIELLVHGWDLARATGQQASFPADVAERALAAARQQLESRPQGPGAAFAAEVPVAEDAPAVDRLAGFLGRPV
jgi:uncharacterized protein (TIGR03086 family)